MDIEIGGDCLLKDRWGKLRPEEIVEIVFGTWGWEIEETCFWVQRGVSTEIVQSSCYIIHYFQYGKILEYFPMTL